MTDNSRKYLLFANSSTNVALHPEYNYIRDHQKIESSIRTQAGNMFRYNFGKWLRWRFSVSHMETEEAELINRWWQNNTPLFWEDGTATPLYQVILVNRRIPLGQHVLPYANRYRGKIELESYQIIP